MTFERERRIEQMLIDEFRHEGLSVENHGGDWLSYIPSSDDGDGTRIYTGVNLTRLAKAIEARLP